MRINRLLAILLLSCIAAVSASAQNATMTPYSRYGYGILNDNASSMQRAMGGVGYAMNSGRQINVMNPASYAAIDSLTFLFDMGANFDILSAEEAAVKDNSLSGGLDYITMSFPITKRIGASIGLLPFSSTGYSFTDSITNGSSRHDGSGSINEVYVGAGVNPFASLYLGVNMSYMFGNTTNDVYAYTVNGSTSLFQRYISVKDLKFDFGVQYPVNIGRSNRVTLGLAYSPGKGLHGETYGLYYDVSNTSKIDTIGFTDLKGKYSLPATYGVGINYQWRERLMVEGDFTYQPWKDAKYADIDGFESYAFDNRWRAALGMQYTHSPRGSYLQRTQFRAGVYYNHDYLMVMGNNVREYGATVGLGLPVPGFKTMLNLAFQYKHRQAHPDPLIKEQYFNITLGINFNELWFRKSRIY